MLISIVSIIAAEISQKLEMKTGLQERSGRSGAARTKGVRNKACTEYIVGMYIVTMIVIQVINVERLNCAQTWGPMTTKDVS